MQREQRQSQQSRERQMPSGNVNDDSDNYVVLTKTKFDFQRSVVENMSEEDIKMYGAYNRVPNGYAKIEVLGKGGCAVVWLM